MHSTPPAPRAHRPRRILDALALDLKLSVRSLRRAPGFLAVAVVTLALGIGADTAIFSVVRGVLLAPLPYPEPERVVQVWEVSQRGGDMAAARANFEDWREQAESFEALAAYGARDATVLGPDLSDGATRTRVAAVSADLFRVLGTKPERGRLPRPDEHVHGAEPVAVVSHSFWSDELARRSLAGLRLEVAGFEPRVIGVSPPGFDFPEGTDVWFPMELYPPNPHRSSHNWDVLGRLADGVAPVQAQAELTTITERLLADSDAPPEYLASGVHVLPLRDELVGPVRRPLLILLGAAGLVLLVACTNLASAFLARGTERTRELAVRSSLGAGRARLVGQLFVESLVVAGAGAGLGIVLAAAALETLPVLLPDALPRMEAVTLDGPVLAFAALLSVATALLFGLLPGLRITGDRAAAELRSGGRSSADRSWGRSWRVLVAAEVALALMLLAGSGLLIQSLWRILRVDTGFDAESVVTVEISPPGSRYEGVEALATYYTDVEERLESGVGVERAGLLSHVPLSGSGPNGQIEVRGAPEPTADVEYRLATAGALRALEVPLLQGRLFDVRDRMDAPHVVVVDRAMAERVWPGEDPIGKQVNGGGMDGEWGRDRWATVVGVVGDVRDRSLTSEPRPTVYFHALQRPKGSAAAIVRASGEPTAVGRSVVALVREVDPNVPTEVASMERIVRSSVADRRFAASLLGTFAALGLVLSVVGIYGVVAYTVGRRRRELGIRMALGATPGRVRRLVLRESMVPVAWGLAAGVAGALAVSRVLRSLLYEVQPTDPVTLTAVAALLGAAAWAASDLPARKTARIDPVETIRAE